MKSAWSYYLFDGLDNLHLGGGVEVVALLAQQQLEVAGHISPSDVDAHDGVRHGEALIDGHSVCHSVTRVQHHACRSASRITATKNDRLPSNYGLAKKNISHSEGEKNILGGLLLTFI